MDRSLPAGGSALEAQPLLRTLLSSLADGVVVCDVRERGEPIVYANRGFERLTGYSVSEAIGRNCRFLQGEDTADLARRVMSGAISRRESVTATVLNYRRDRTPFWNEVALVPLLDASGELTHYLGLMNDVSERVRAEAQLGRAEILRLTAFNSMREGIIVLSTVGRATDANATALRILGIEREALAEGDWWDRLRVRHPDGRPLEAAESPGLRAFQDRRRIEDVRLLIRRADGIDRLISFSYEPLIDGALDQPQALVVSLDDVTERERSEVDLQLFASVVETSSDFISIADLDGTVSYVNPAGRRLVGLDDVEPVGGRRIREFLPAEAWKAFVTSHHPVILSEGSWRGENALRHFRTSESIPVRISAYLVRHPETGDPVAMATVARDISAEQRFTADLIRSRERYEAQFRSLPLPTYVWQRRGDDFYLVEWNGAADEATGGALERLREARAGEMYADSPEVRLGLERCWSTRTHVTLEQSYRMRSTGEVRHLIVTYAWVPEDLVLIHTLDITDRVEYERRLKEMAEHDDLTGLHNRRFFEQRLQHSVGTREVSLLLVDIDHFKFVNDSFGHDAGDELLREIARTMTSRLREQDLLARLGGDEFAILIDDCDAARARAVAGHLLAAIRSTVSGASVTASCGVATFDANVTIAPSDALVAADIALYEAKQRGRDRLEVFSGQAGQSLAGVEQIRGALATDRLRLFGQPILDLRAPDDPVGYELLIRMVSEDGKIIPPSSFLPTAEQFGLMRDIDRWVIDHGIAFAARGYRVSLNLSPPDRSETVTCPSGSARRSSGRAHGRGTSRSSSPRPRRSPASRMPAPSPRHCSSSAAGSPSTTSAPGLARSCCSSTSR